MDVPANQYLANELSPAIVQSTLAGYLSTNTGLACEQISMALHGMACNLIQFKGVIEMPRFNGTGLHGQGALSGRRLGRCEGADACAGNGRRLRHRHGQVMGGRFHITGPMQDHSLVASGITKLQSEIEALQVRIDKLKALAEK